TTAVQLDLFTAICDSGSSPDDIAAHCHASARGVRVLCDYLCVLGLLQKRHERYWPTEETALYLDRRSPHFIGDAAIQMFARRTFRGWLSTSDASGPERRNGARVGGQSGARACLLGAIRAGPRTNRRGKWEAPCNIVGKFLIRSNTGPRYCVRARPPRHRDREIEPTRGDFCAGLAGGPRSVAVEHAREAGVSDRTTRYPGMCSASPFESATTWFSSQTSCLTLGLRSASTC